MGSVEVSQPHAILVPYPSQGHVTPFMQLAKLLHSRGFHITFVNTEFNHRRLIKSLGAESVRGLPDFQFETIPDGLPPSDSDATQHVPSLCASLQTTCLDPIKGLIYKLNSSPQGPKVTCLIADGAMSVASKAAKELGLKETQFWTASACSFIAYIHFKELWKRGILPMKGTTILTDGTLEQPVDWIPGIKDIRLKHIPNFFTFDEFMFGYMNSEAEHCLKSSATFFNTFDELEHEALKEISAIYPNIYTVGPLSILGRNDPRGPTSSFCPSLWREDPECLQWLDQRQPRSVIYVNYGSVAVMSDETFKEFAYGLANSKHPFLWIVRPDVVSGKSGILPEGFLEETKDRGLLANWCEQEKVLAHPAVGAFLTHCGWNSMLEAFCGGVPVICWPFFADQHTNCRFSCTTWGIGMEVNQVVKREEVEELVKEMMGGETGRELRKNALEWKRKAEEVTDVGGESYDNFSRFIEKELLQDFVKKPCL